MNDGKQIFKIVASDLDGTLLTPRHQLNDFTKQVLVRLHDRGLIFVFATGRHHVDVAGIRQQAGIPAYMVTSNGARVHDPDDQLLYAENVAEDLVQPIVDLVRQDPDIGVNLFKDEEWLLSKEDDGMKTFHKESGFDYRLYDASAAPTEGVAKIFFMHDDHDHLVTFEEKLNAQFGERVNVSFSAPFCLEVMAAGVSKGDAMKAVADSVKVGLEECIAFGDGMNDIEMLTMAGKGLLMGSAHPRVKTALPDVERIESNSNDGVARYLLEHLL